MCDVKTIGTFNCGLTGGGIERVVAVLSGLWLKAGYRVVVFTDKPVTLCDDFDLPKGVVHKVLPKCGTDREDAWISSIREDKIDVLVHHQFSSKNFAGDIEVAKKGGIKTVVVMHEPFSAERYGVEGWNNSLYVKPFPCVDAMVCLSPTEALWWGSTLHRPVFYIPNPLPFDCNTPIVWQKEASRDILWIGRFASRKRLEDAIRAYAIVAQQDKDARLVVLGSSSRNEVNRRFRRFVHQLGVSDRVVFAGRQKDVAQFLRNAYAHLSTSVSESYALTLAESKAHGVPIVMYNLPYLALSDGNRGILTAEIGDVQGLAQALIMILHDVDFRNRLGDEGRKSLEPLENERVIQDWKRVLRTIHRDPTGSYSELPHYQTQEYYQFVLNEITRSWQFFMRENAWKMKLFEWMSSHFPMSWVKSFIKARRPDLF